MYLGVLASSFSLAEYKMYVSRVVILLFVLMHRKNTYVSTMIAIITKKHYMRRKHQCYIRPQKLSFSFPNTQNSRQILFLFISYFHHRLKGLTRRLTVLLSVLLIAV